MTSIILSLFTATAQAKEPQDKPAASALTGPKPDAVAPPSAEALEAAIDRGVDYLLRSQHANGSWGSARNTKGLNIYAPVPGAHGAFRAAVTAMSLMALMEVDREKQNEKVTAAIDRGAAWLLENLDDVRRASPDAIYNVWTHAYGIQALVRLHARTTDEAQRAEIRALIEQQIDMLDRYESVDGGWGYYDFNVGSRVPTSSSTSFVNAAVLVALHEANAIGIAPPAKMLHKALAATERQRKPDCSYFYGESLKHEPMAGINRPGGSVGRSQACNLALYLWQQKPINQAVLAAWLDRLFARGGWLDIGRKRPVPHESWFQIAGYFYYFGHYYGARCIAELPAEQRPFYQAHMAQTLLARQEKEGSWWDYPFYDYHEAWGTSFALMSLVRCRGG
jgi:hypothetical protein